MKGLASGVFAVGFLLIVLPARPAAQQGPPPSDPAAVALADALLRAPESDRRAILDQAPDSTRKLMRAELIGRANGQRNRQDMHGALATANLLLWIMNAQSD